MLNICHANDIFSSTLHLYLQGCYCSVCEMMLSPSNGKFCDCCLVCADPSCIKRADQLLKCKEKVIRTSDRTTHLWVKGNLPPNCICFACNEDVDYHSVPGLYGYRCCMSKVFSTSVYLAIISHLF